MTDIRVYPGVSSVARATADAAWMAARGTRDGAVAIHDWKSMAVMEGRAYVAFSGTENAPVNTTTSIDDILVFTVLDVASGTTVIPISAQCEVAVWTTGALLNFMVEVDNAKARYSSAGTAFTPINLRTDAPIASTSTVYVMKAADDEGVVVGAKSSGGSLELYRTSVEVNLGDAADGIPTFHWQPKVSPVLVGPASLIIHFGCGTADMQGYGNIQWIEIPSTDLT